MPRSTLFYLLCTTLVLSSATTALTQMPTQNDLLGGASGLDVVINEVLFNPSGPDSTKE